MNKPKPSNVRTGATAGATTTPRKSGQGEKKTEKIPSTVSTPAKGATKKAETKELKPPPGPRAPSPPPKGNPSGVMLALARLLELEASMEYAYAKHMLLVKRQKELGEQYKVLETLPVGIDAIKEDLQKPLPDSAQQDV